MHQEINVIGQRAEEARDAVDEFLDRAVMATASRVRIVHGHGMGVLKKTIAELLSRHPHVAKFYGAAAGRRRGSDHRGTAGVTCRSKDCAYSRSKAAARRKWRS